MGDDDKRKRDRRETAEGVREVIKALPDAEVREVYLDALDEMKRRREQNPEPSALVRELIEKGRWEYAVNLYIRQNPKISFEDARTKLSKYRVPRLE